MAAHKYEIWFAGDATYELKITCDELTMNELIQVVNPIIRKIISDGNNRSKGIEVKKPCGCG